MLTLKNAGCNMEMDSDRFASNFLSALVRFSSYILTFFSPPFLSASNKWEEYSQNKINIYIYR